MTVQELISGIKDENPDVRANAVLNAGPAGAIAIQPLAGLMSASGLEVGRAAKRAMWKIVRHAGRPGADDERKQVVASLIALVDGDRDVAVVCEALWMLSESAGEEAVDAVAALLSKQELREYARLTLERIPGNKSLAALQQALDKMPEDFKPNIAQSLRKRGVEVPDLPCKKLKPVKQTKVKPVGR